MSIFAVTVSLHPEIYDQSAEEQYEYTRSLLYEAVRTIKSVKDISMRAEITKKGQIHWHLAVWLDSQCAAYIFKELLDVNLVMVNSLMEAHIFGFTCVKKCTDIKKWIWYINKNPYSPKVIYLFDPFYEVK